SKESTQATSYTSASSQSAGSGASTTPSTKSTPSSSASETGFTTSQPFTTTMVCPLTEGMTSPQYLDSPQLTDAKTGTVPSDLKPGSPGVTFTTPDAKVVIPLAPGIAPIVTEVSVPNPLTNVVEITVTFTPATSDTPVRLTSPTGTNTVDNFPITPLKEGSTITITFVTTNNQPPENVTLSVIACFVPSTATTIVSSSTAPITVSGPTPTLTISSTSTGTGMTEGIVYKAVDIRHWLKTLLINTVTGFRLNK
ncbi:unnamed protein product, partial [Rotaria socialis]